MTAERRTCVAITVAAGDRFLRYFGLPASVQNFGLTGLVSREVLFVAGGGNVVCTTWQLGYGADSLQARVIRTPADVGPCNQPFAGMTAGWLGNEFGVATAPPPARHPHGGVLTGPGSDLRLSLINHNPPVEEIV